MPKTTMTTEQLTAHLDKFLEDHEDEQGLLSAEDQVTFDAMLAGLRTMGGTKRFRRQADLDKNPPRIAGAGKGVQLVDEKGRIHRALSRDESFADAVREHPERFNVSADDEKLVDDGLTLGNICRALVSGPQTSAERFALSTSNATSAGYTVPEILSAQIIDRFRTKTVLMKAGAQTLPLDSESHSFAKLTGDATPSWRRETTSITESEQTFGRLTFYPKSLAVLVKCTRELLQDSPNIGDAIERSLTAAFAVELDRVGLLGAGNAEPVGLRNETGLNEITGIGALTDYSDFVDAIKLMMDDNTPDPTAAVVANRDWTTLAKLEDSTGQPLMIPPAVSDLPFMATSAIPTTLGGGTESVGFVGYFPDFVFGMRSQLQIELLKELYAGTHHYAFVAHLRCDTGVFHAESFCRLLGITP